MPIIWKNKIETLDTRLLYGKKLSKKNRKRATSQEWEKNRRGEIKWVKDEKSKSKLTKILLIGILAIGLTFSGLKAYNYYQSTKISSYETENIYDK